MRIYKYIKYILILLITASCVKRTSLYTGYSLNNTLRYPILSEPPTLDWNKNTDRTGALILTNIMSGLSKYDFADGKIKVKPDLAVSWEHDDKYRVWRFRIRKSVKWSDSREFTAQDILDSWERLLNPKTGAEYAYFLFPIKQAQAYSYGKIKDFSKVGVKVINPYLLEVHLKNSMSYFPYLMTFPATFPIRKDVIKKYRGLWTEPRHIVTLGPYRLATWEHDKALILKRNITYYGKAPHIEKVLIYIIPEEKTILDLFQAGRLDVVPSLTSRDLVFYKKHPNYIQEPILSLYYYGFNTKDSVLKNPKVRKAIIHAINRKEIIKLFHNGQNLLKSWIPKGLFGYSSDIGLSFDPKKARRLMQESGYKDMNQFPTLEISYNTTVDHKMLAENIQSQLKKNLNMRIELSNQEWKTYLKKVSTGKVQIFRLGWLADYPDPDNFMVLMTSFSDNNHTGWKNKTFDKLVQQAQALPDNKTRLALYRKAQKILLEEDAVVFPVFSSILHKLISPRLQNFPLNVMSEVSFDQIKIKPN